MIGNRILVGVLDRDYRMISSGMDGWINGWMDGRLNRGWMVV